MQQRVTYCDVRCRCIAALGHYDDRIKMKARHADSWGAAFAVDCNKYRTIMRYCCVTVRRSFHIPYLGREFLEAVIDSLEG